MIVDRVKLRIVSSLSCCVVKRGLLTTSTHTHECNSLFSLPLPFRSSWQTSNKDCYCGKTVATKSQYTHKRQYCLGSGRRSHPAATGIALTIFSLLLLLLLHRHTRTAAAAIITASNAVVVTTTAATGAPRRGGLGEGQRIQPQDIATALRGALEDAFVRFGVDLTLHGHHHS